MRRRPFSGLLLGALTLACLTSSASLQAQQPTPTAVAKEQLAVYAKAFTAIAQLRDQIQAELAAPRNKTDEAQAALHKKLTESIANILKDHNLSDEQYRRITYAVSSDTELRKTLDELLGIKPPPPAPAAPAPSGESSSGARTHLGHVTTAFSGTPEGKGLLPTALAEASVMVQHAALAAKNASNLESMKTHAGHVIHAIDPAESANGPGSGYGLKKAASNIAAHIELAAKAQGATQTETTHAVHIATSARNVVQRADQIVALAKQIQASGAASDAAALVAKLNTLATQLVDGVDANADGRIGWQEGEGGLKHVEQHVALMQGM